MGEHRGGHAFHVVRLDEVAAADGGHGLAGAEQGDRGAGAAPRAKSSFSRVSWTICIRYWRTLSSTFTSRTACWQAISSSAGTTGCKLVEGCSVLEHGEHFQFFVHAGIAQGEPHQEAVELSFGQAGTCLRGRSGSAWR